MHGFGGNDDHPRFEAFEGQHTRMNGAHKGWQQKLHKLRVVVWVCVGVRIANPVLKGLGLAVGVGEGSQCSRSDC